MNHREAARMLACVMDRLRDERKRQGRTLQGLERISGVTRTTIAKMEKGEWSPSLIICLRIADALGVQLGDALNSVPAKKSERRK
jgi:transcriptional regulator with XRE-family HTH domain